jgi:hypothetical protein
MWMINLGAKSIDEIAKKDNSVIGLIFLIIVVLVFYSKI